MTPKDLGLKIKNIRITKNLTQQEFSDLLVIAPQTLSKWERGMSIPNIFYIKKMCEVLGVSIIEIVGEDRENSGDDYYVAVDGGGTKTEFVLFKSDGTVVASTVLGTTNPNSCGIESSADLIEDLDSALNSIND